MYSFCFQILTNHSWTPFSAPTTYWNCSLRGHHWLPYSEYHLPLLSPHPPCLSFPPTSLKIPPFYGSSCLLVRVCYPVVPFRLPPSSIFSPPEISSTPIFTLSYLFWWWLLDHSATPRPRATSALTHEPKISFVSAPTLSPPAHLGYSPNCLLSYLSTQLPVNNSKAATEMCLLSSCYCPA